MKATHFTMPALLSAAILAAGLLAPIGGAAAATGGNHMDCRAKIAWVMQYVNRITYTQEKVVILGHLDQAKEDMAARREESCVAHIATVKQMLGIVS